MPNTSRVISIRSIECDHLDCEQRTANQSFTDAAFNFMREDTASKLKKESAAICPVLTVRLLGT